MPFEFHYTRVMEVLEIHLQQMHKICLCRVYHLLAISID